MKRKLLLVEDQVPQMMQLKVQLEGLGCEVHTAATIQGAKDALNDADYQVVITDMRLPPDDKSLIDLNGGVHVVECACKVNPLVRCIVMTLYKEYENVVKCMEAGACSYIEKDKEDSYKRLNDRVRSAFTHYDREQYRSQLVGYYTMEFGCPIQPMTHRCNRTQEICDRFDRRNVFLAIPFNEYLDEQATIDTVVRDSGLKPIFLKEEPRSGQQLCNVCLGIRTCKYAVVDISRLNKVNIFYELGLLHALSKKVAVLFDTNQGKKTPPSDLRGLQFVRYHQTDAVTLSLRLALAKWIQGNVDEAKDEKVTTVIQETQAMLANT